MQFWGRPRWAFEQARGATRGTEPHLHELRIHDRQAEVDVNRDESQLRRESAWRVTRGRDARFARDRSLGALASSAARARGARVAPSSADSTRKQFAGDGVCCTRRAVAPRRGAASRSRGSAASCAGLTIRESFSWSGMVDASPTKLRFRDAPIAPQSRRIAQAAYGSGSGRAGLVGFPLAGKVDSSPPRGQPKRCRARHRIGLRARHSEGRVRVAPSDVAGRGCGT